jgi:hypothetical protein
MEDYHQMPGFTSGKKRIQELRKKRTRSGIDESISKSRSMILINLTIEIATAIILVVGLLYFVRFLIMRRPYIDQRLYKVGLGCLTVFTVGWTTYLFIKIRSHIRLLQKTDRKS